MIRQIAHDAGIISGSFTVVAGAALLTGLAFGTAVHHNIPQAAPTSTTRSPEPATTPTPVISRSQTPSAAPHQAGTVLVDTVDRTSSLPAAPRSTTAPPGAPGAPPPVSPPASPPPVTPPPPPRTVAAIAVKVPLGVLPTDTVRVGDILQIGGTGK